MIITQKFFYMPEDYRCTTVVKEKPTKSENLIEYPTSMFFDQATKTGMCIFDKKGRLVTTLRIEKKPRTSMVEFRSKFRKKIQELIHEYKVNRLFCEDVFSGVNFETTQKLLSIRDLLMDLAYENGIKAFPINNMKWKSRLSYPTPWSGFEDDKAQVERYVKKYYPLIDFDLDVVDSIGMAIAVLFKLNTNMRPIEMQLDKKLSIINDVVIAKPGEGIDDILNKSKIKGKFKGLEVKQFDYDTTLDLNTNFRYILSNYDVIAVTEIPYHRYYGQILMDYDIRPSEIGEDGRIVGISVKKY